MSPAAAATRPASGAQPSRHTVLSLGGGMQSTTLALLAARGELACPEFAVFADTGWEPAAVYEHLEWLRSELAETMPIHVVRKYHADGRPAHIRADTLAVVRAGRPTDATHAGHVPDATGPDRPGVGPRQPGRGFVVLPVYALDHTGKASMLRRQCTGEYKLDPICAKVRELIGRRRGLRAEYRPQVEMWIGISAEEHPRRCKPSVFGWVHNRYPLRELGWTRRRCEEWLWEHYRRKVLKSSCVGCPFHDDAYWRDMKRHRPDEWAEAVAFDREIRHLPGVRGTCYLHRSGLPLAEVDLRTAEERGQLSFTGELFDPTDGCQP
jgi:hypothetical protein